MTITKEKNKPNKGKAKNNSSISPKNRNKPPISQGAKKVWSEFPPDMIDSEDEGDEANEGDGFVQGDHADVRGPLDKPSISRAQGQHEELLKCLEKKRAQGVKEGPLEINVVEGEHGVKAKRKGKVTIDSGAEVSIWPASHVAWKNVKPTRESERGVGFVAANGARMNNYGGTQIMFKKDGKVKGMNFEVTDCKKPLASVAKIVDKGNRVVFDEDESYIYNKKTGEKIMLERERGTFVMLVEFEVDDKASDENSCFRRHA